MITKDNFKTVLEFLSFTNKSNVYIKKFDELDCELKVDFNKKELIYPKHEGLTINERQTCNFQQNENFVVFECVHRLLNQGYHPKHIELEPKWPLGHGASGGRADILVKDNHDKALLIIECKTSGSEFTKAWTTTQTKPTQLFSYMQQVRSTKFISLYASDFLDDTVVSNYYLINVVDNEELLKHNPKLESYKKATTVEEIYQVWSETYSKDYATIGLFEDNKPYDIGKTKFTSKDLKHITSKDIQGKYHEFATILRQHNVSGRENAFDKLVNLFLCKVTDEKENPDELKFYWKGKAYDNPFDFQDRLQKLYKEGMDKFLDDKITYIDNSLIDEAFDVFKDKKNETKRLVKEYLKAQKFFTNNDFAFIDVHNEPLFYQNFEVLLKIARMIQDISLTRSDENQFLGDMFEGFLDQGVKQSEGQFFTPMPIVKFIIHSLPNKKEPKVIDYACGAGHFLNEYASINKDSQIVGIEKEYRLSKVAKVSSFMYGNDMTIIYDDALKKTKKVEDAGFDVLIANPPYSVKGFLETLSHEERKNYELIDTIEEKSFSANNAIECFFIERSKQLLQEDGVVGIIVPSSILNKGSQSITSHKGNIYVRTREIILKYFDMVAIAEFGSGTFGKTGTNTVTLFLKRRGDNPAISNHFNNMVDTWFESDFDTNKAFEDNDLLEKYCHHIDVELSTYKTLLCENLDETIFEHDTFKEYKIEFEKLSETKNRKKKKTYKALSDEEKATIEQKERITYIRAIEKDKLYYFCLAYKNSSDVILIKSPSKNSDNKKFLGYEWSSAKGNEGIKYLSSGNVPVEDTNLNEEYQRILENLQGLKHINTPLYNPQISDDETKINTIIKNNFIGIKTKIPEELQPFVSRSKLIDMLDFTRVDFNKALSLTPSKKVEVFGKPEWQNKLGDIVNVLIGGTPSRKNSEYFEGEHSWVSISEMNGQIITKTKEKISDEGIKNSNVKLIPKGTTLLSFKLSIGKTAIAGVNLYTNEAIAGLVPKSKNLRDEYLFHLFNGQIINLEKDNMNVFGKSLNSTFLKNEIRIPLPPLDIQDNIVKECQTIDDEVVKAKESIEQIKEDIGNEIQISDGKVVKLSDYFKTSAGGTPLTSRQEYYLNGNIPWINSGEVKQGLILDSETKITQLGLENSSAKIFPIDTVLIAMYGATTGEVGILGIEASTNQAVCGIFPNLQISLPKYLYFYLREKTNELKGLSKGVARSNISQEVIKNYKISLPSLEIQKQIITKIEKLESKITKAQHIIEEAKRKKEEVLRNYL